jgi:hypothetical protein
LRKASKSAAGSIGFAKNSVVAAKDIRALSRGWLVEEISIAGFE